MRVVDLDGVMFVPVVDETHGGAVVEVKMTVAEFFEKCCPGFAPEAMEAIPVEWLEEFDKYYGGGVCDVRTILTAWRKSQEG